MGKGFDQAKGVTERDVNTSSDSAGFGVLPPLKIGLVELVGLPRLTLGLAFCLVDDLIVSNIFTNVPLLFEY